MEFYKLPYKDILNHLHTAEKGLSQKEANRRLETYGLNIIPEARGRNLFVIFLNQFTSPLIFILVLAGVLTYLFEEYKDTIVIAIAVISNAIIGFIQEFNAERSIKSLKNMLVPKALVFRDYDEVEIPSTKIVPGDIVIITAGFKVPADIRLMSATELTVDESSLTGESFAVEKNTNSLSKDNLTPGDQKNMVFMGTTILKGRGIGVVVQTGENTILGSIASRISNITIAKTPLQLKMNRFAQFISGIVLVGILLIFSSGLFMGLPTKEIFFQVIAVAVAAIPEGLPIVVTIAMAIGIKRMARNNTIIRTLPSVETLGSTTVICSDKTGTLTQNQMTVTKIYDGVSLYNLTGTGYNPKGNIYRETTKILKPQEGLLKTLKIGVLCNESVIVHKENTIVINGDPTEGALIISALKGDIHQEKIQNQSPTLQMIPFQSGKNYMATLHLIEGEKYIYVKGSPETLISLSKKTENSTKQDYLNAAEEMAKEGLRVLGMAYKKVAQNTTSISDKDITQLTFCGIQGMLDPIRKQAIHAVKSCQKAGIRVVMITGDHAVTAKSIASKIGINSINNAVLTGNDIENMSDSTLYSNVESVSVFARVSPEHKLRIVQQLMKHGEIVAVTGDGVNDAPALKAAHIGIAMGKTGTDVAKEAANMIIRDDNFASIFRAVYEGRVVFDNIRKAVAFLIPIGFAAIITILVTILLGIPSPYLAVQLLWINLVASGIQDIALAFEPGDRHIIRQSPRSPSEGIMSRVLLQRTILVGTVISIGVLFIYITSLQRGVSLDVARTMAITTMVFFQFFQVLNSRSEKESIFKMDPLSNKFLFFGLIGSLFSHLLVIYHPALEWLFSMQPLSFIQWVQILLTASTILIVVEIDKAIRRN